MTDNPVGNIPVQTLTGRTALVTGSSRGIGKCIALSLAAAGASVVVHGRDRDAANDVCRWIVAAGGQAAPTTGDLTDDDAVRAVASQANAAVGPIDILVNNVGGVDLSGRNDWNDIQLPDWQSTFRLNLFSAVAMTHCLAPAMIERGWGRIIQISSRSAVLPTGRVADYAAAKAALNSFTLSLAKSLAGTGVTANTIMPGPIAHEPAPGTGSAHFASPDTVARLVVQLAEAGSSFVNGSEILADGGYR